MKRVDKGKNLYKISFLLIVVISSIPSLKAQSMLLENVKRNPSEAIALCKKFKELNAKGISSSSKEVIKAIGRQKNLNDTDAEILSIYVIGMNCPEVN